MGERERHGVLIEQARIARGSLALALELLQRHRAPRAQAARAVERLARASNALYRAEVESKTPQATTQGIHLAVEELRQALSALHAGGLTSEGEAAGAVVAGALATLYPLVSATRRQRRKVVIVREGEGAAKPVGSRLTRRTPSMRPRPAPVDRRAAQAPRFPLRLEVSLIVAGAVWSSTSANISHGGLFVISDRLLPPGTEVTVRFVLPNGHAVVAQGTVRWSRSAHQQQQPGMGLCFRGLSAQDGQQLANYCRL